MDKMDRCRNEGCARAAAEGGTYCSDACADSSFERTVRLCGLRSGPGRVSGAALDVFLRRRGPEEE